MKRRRFIASIIAATAGLLGLKAARAERVSELVLGMPRYYVTIRLSDGEVMGAGVRSIRGPVDGMLGPFAQCIPAFDRVGAFSPTSHGHAVELAEAARLRYVIGSAMKASI